MLRKEKVYPLSREERGEMCKFIEEQLEKDYIRLYRYFNEWTIKNNYSLPLILDIIDNIGIKKVFTKIDLR